MYSPESDSVYSQTFDGPSMSKNISELRDPDSRPGTSEQPPSRDNNLTLPSTTFKDKRQSYMSQRSDMSAGGDEFLIPLAFDPTPPVQSPKSPTMPQQGTPRMVEERPRDYFSRSTNSPAQQPTAQLKNQSPHIAYQEKGRLPSRDALEGVGTRKDASGSRSGSAAASPYTAPEQIRPTESNSVSQTARTGVPPDDKFKLQEAPKAKKPSPSLKESSKKGPLLQATVTGPLDPEPDFSDNAYSTPRMSLESSPASMNESPKPPQHPNAAALLANLPKRGDSLDSAKRNQAIPRKELKPSANINPIADVLQNSATNSKTPAVPADLTKANGGKVISQPIESPNSKSIFDTPSMKVEGTTGTESFTDPRAPPQPPQGYRARNESVSTMQSEAQKGSEAQKSPSLPRYSTGGDFTMDEDMARIMGNEEAGNSFLRRVSNSVRHGRSYSDKAGRLSRDRDRWPRSPGMGSTLGHEISSPTTTSPEHREELAWFKNELRKERQKLIDREKRITELEAQIGSNADIKQVNSELKEKRSTMVVLDTQKEIVVRELEVLTDHIANAKANKEPLDVGKMTNAVIRDFATQLEKLKNSFAPQIEDSIQKRNDLVDEIAQLTQMKDKSFAEFEQLSSKNAQLAELNNQLVHQIQELYKANSGPQEATKVNGLGIYGHHKDKSQISVDATRSMSVDASMVDSATTLTAGEAEPITVLQGPHVVNIRKGQAKKFDWRKGQKVAKGVTKGLKGAFSSAQQSYSRDLQFAETGAYGQNLQGSEYSQMPRTNQEPQRQGFGFFGGNQKAGGKTNGLYAAQGNASTPSLIVDAASRMLSYPPRPNFTDSITEIYGSDIEQRAEFEKTTVPMIVKRCVEEVEARGEYRKSSSSKFLLSHFRHGRRRHLPQIRRQLPSPTSPRRLRTRPPQRRHQRRRPRHPRRNLRPQAVLPQTPHSPHHIRRLR
jgi:Rho-type GTPase-activating protein 1/2